MLKTIPISTTSSLSHNPKNNINYAKSRNRFILFKQLRTTCLLYSKFDFYSRATVTCNITQNQIDKICNFCQMGNLRNAMELLTTSQRHELAVSTYCSVLQLCAEKNSLEDGKRVHSIIISNGMVIDEVLGAKLVFMYATCGDLVNARRIFDEILNDKVFLWNLMMSEYSKIGDYRKSLSLFMKMQKMGVLGDSYTFTRVFNCFAALGKVVMECKMVHGYILKLGFGSNTAVVTSMIAAYFEFGEVESAHNLFDELADRDVVSWNSMMSEYAKIGDYKESLSLFMKMQKMGVLGNCVTFTCVFKCFAALGKVKECKRVHGYILKLGFGSNTAVVTSMITAYFEFGEVESAHNLFDELADRDVVSWNSMMSDYAKIGYYREIVSLFKKMQKMGVSGDSYTFTCVFKCFAALRKVKECKRVHGYVYKLGFGSNTAVVTSMIAAYFEFGEVERAHNLFDELADRDVVSWNSMMSEYAKIGYYREIVSLFKKMQKMGVSGDSYTFTCVFKCFAALRKVKECKRVHGYVYKLGFGSNAAVVNSVIATYFKFGDVESARNLFDELADRDVVSWNSVINGCVVNGFSKNGVEIFIQMLDMGVNWDLTILVSVLVASANIGNLSFGRALHAFGVKASFVKEVVFSNTLLDMYSKCGNLNGASEVFAKMADTTIVSWTSIIAAYVREGLYDDAIGLFDEMQSKGVRPDIYTVTSIVHACACSNSLDKGRDVHSYIIKNGMGSNLPVANALMNMYAKCGSVEEARLVFSQIRAKDIVSWNTMIGGYSQNSLPSEALELFSDMQKQLKPDDITMACVLPACAGLAALDKGREIHGHILRRGYFSDLHVACALVDMYAKCGLLVLAQLLFDMIPQKDLISWTVMIAGYGMHGFGNEAISTFNKMRIAGIEPDESSFAAILNACSHSGLLHEGWRFFNFMRNECGIEPKLEHYACMVDLLSCAGNLSKAYKFIESMPIDPDATIWGALLSGCRIHHDVKLAEKVAEHLFELEPDNTRYYVVLANVYAKAEKWEEVKKLQEKMRKKRFKQIPGCSWIEFGGKFNIFVAGNTKHPQAKRIEALLRKLSLQMKNDMEKEVIQCGHSEKLAMAFGILNLPPGRTIRVTKNRRVCEDCHEMGKFMSKTTKREILLIDSNRFHHFKDGLCSCRGFW